MELTRATRAVVGAQHVDHGELVDGHHLDPQGALDAHRLRQSKGARRSVRRLVSR